MKRLTQPEEENDRLQQAVADPWFDGRTIRVMTILGSGSPHVAAVQGAS